MRYFGLISYGLLAIGLVLVVAGAAFSLGATFVLAGLLLAWAGLTKLVVVQLWRGVAAPERTTVSLDEPRSSPRQ